MGTTNTRRSTRGVWATRLAAAVAIAALGLTACSNNEEPEKSAVEIAAESNAKTASDGGGDDASDSGEADGFAMPPENEGILPPDRANYPGIDTETDEGAKQTVKFFFDAMYYGYATGDTAPLESVSGSGCKQCKSTVGEIEERTTKLGMFNLGHTIEAVDLTTVESDRPGQTAVYYLYLEPPADQVSEENGLVSFPGTKMDSATYLKFFDGQWRVSDVNWVEYPDE
ncbi:MAG: DUF6318 family protein [Dermabacter sp.]|nr:DUF6318 family protein [Dermabacter sp.]